MKINNQLDNEIEPTISSQPIIPVVLPSNQIVDSVSVASTDLFVEKLHVYHPHCVQKRCELMASHIDEELNQKSVNFDKLQALVYNYVTLHMRHQAKTHHEYINNARDDINELAKKIKNTHNCWSSLGLTILGVVGNVVAASWGIDFLKPANINITRRMLSSLSGVSQIVQGLSKIPESQAEGQRGLFNHELEYRKQQENKRHESSQKDHGMAKEAKEALAELQRQANEARRAATAA